MSRPAWSFAPSSPGSASCCMPGRTSPRSRRQPPRAGRRGAWRLSHRSPRVGPRPSDRPPGRYDAAMRLTAWEDERLLLFAAAELARRHRDAGLFLNGPEAIALICDAMLEAARAGLAYDDVEDAGRVAVDPSEVMPGVRELVDEVRLEVLMGDGARLVVLVDPLGDGVPDAGRTSGP